MTGMLASAMSLEEADIIVKAGVDILDLKQPAYGALGALEQDVILSIVEKYTDKITISATIGDVPLDTRKITQAIENLRPTNVDIIKIGIFGKTIDSSLLESLRSYQLEGLKIVLVFFADLLVDYSDILHNIDSSTVHGVMLDTANKQTGSLMDQSNFEQIAEFIEQARSKNLISGLAGSLVIDDIEYLLALNPNYLGFRGALCRHTERTEEIDELSVHRVRSKISNTKDGLKQFC